MASPDAEKADSAAESAQRAGRTRSGTTSSRATSSPASRSRTRSRSSWRPAARPTRCCTTWRSPRPPGVKWTHRRLRARAPQGAGAVRPQALGPLRRGRLPPRGRRAAGAEDAARERRAARRLHDHHTARPWPKMLKDVPAEPRTDQDVIRPWSQADVQAGPPRDPQGQSRARGLRREDHRPEEPVDHRPGARVRLRARVHEGDHGQEDQGGRRGRDPLRGPEGRARHAGDARADLGADRAGAGRIGRACSPTGASPAAPGAWWSATSRPRPTSAARSRW